MSKAREMESTGLCCLKKFGHGIYNTQKHTCNLNFIFLFECKHALPFQPVPVATGMSTAVPLLFENGHFPSFVLFEKIDWYRELTPRLS